MRLPSLGVTPTPYQHYAKHRQDTLSAQATQAEQLTMGQHLESLSRAEDADDLKKKTKKQPYILFDDAFAKAAPAVLTEYSTPKWMRLCEQVNQWLLLLAEWLLVLTGCVCLLNGCC